MVQRWGTVSLVVGLLAITSCSRPGHVGTVDRIDVALEIRADGSIDVREELTVGRGVAPGTVITRVIAPEQADSLEFVSAQVDGSFAGGRPEGVTVDAPARPLTIRWQTPPGADRSHVLTLNYRAFRTVFVDEPRARVQWQAIPKVRGYDVGATRVTLKLPAGVAIYDGTGIAESGWSVERTPTGIVANRMSIPDGQGAMVFAEFDLLRDTTAESDWQAVQDRQWNLIPSYATGALFMFVIGGATLFSLRKQYPRRGSENAVEDMPRPDPDKLMVARGLLMTAWIGGVFSLGCSVLSYVWFPSLSHWLQLIPGSMVIVAVVFYVASKAWQREARE